MAGWQPPRARLLVCWRPGASVLSEDHADRDLLNEETQATHLGSAGSPSASERQLWGMGPVVLLGGRHGFRPHTKTQSRRICSLEAPETGPGRKVQ